MDSILHFPIKQNLLHCLSILWHYLWYIIKLISLNILFYIRKAKHMFLWTQHCFHIWIGVCHNKTNLLCHIRSWNWYKILICERLCGDGCNCNRNTWRGRWYSSLLSLSLLACARQHSREIRRIQLWLLSNMKSSLITNHNS